VAIFYRQRTPKFPNHKNITTDFLALALNPCRVRKHISLNSRVRVICDLCNVFFPSTEYRRVSSVRTRTCVYVDAMYFEQNFTKKKWQIVLNGCLKMKSFITPIPIFSNIYIVHTRLFFIKNLE